jgi:hypothetical protein
MRTSKGAMACKGLGRVDETAHLLWLVHSCSPSIVTGSAVFNFDTNWRRAKTILACFGPMKSHSAMPAGKKRPGTSALLQNTALLFFQFESSTVYPVSTSR